MLVPKSSRWVGDADALRVVRAVRGGLTWWASSSHPAPRSATKPASRYRLAAVQVHGDFERSLVTACSVPVIPVFNVEDRATASTIDWPRTRS